MFGGLMRLFTSWISTDQKQSHESVNVDTENDYVCQLHNTMEENDRYPQKRLHTPQISPKKKIRIVRENKNPDKEWLCPVEGCGVTFTRKTNCKAHMEKAKVHNSEDTEGLEPIYLGEESSLRVKK